MHAFKSGNRDVESHIGNAELRLLGPARCWVSESVLPPVAMHMLQLYSLFKHACWMCRKEIVQLTAHQVIMLSYFSGSALHCLGG